MRGRAEAIRVFLHARHAEFEDCRIVDANEWEVIKPSLPFGGLPTFETDTALICESHAILRHLGRTLSSSTRCEEDYTRLDAAHDAIATFQEDLWRFNWIENYYDHLESYAEEKLIPRLRMLSNWFDKNRDASAEWFNGEFSHVDSLAFCFLDEIDAFFPAILADFKGLSSLRNRVAKLPGASEYLSSSSRPIVFGIGSMGPKVDPRVSIPPEYLFLNPWSAPLDLLPFLKNQQRLTNSSD